MPAEPRPGSWTNGYVAASTRTVSRCGRPISGRSESTDPAPVLQAETQGQREGEPGRLLAVHPDQLELRTAGDGLYFHTGGCSGHLLDQQRRDEGVEVVVGGGERE